MDIVVKYPFLRNARLILKTIPRMNGRGNLVISNLTNHDTTLPYMAKEQLRLVQPGSPLNNLFDLQKN